MMDDSRGRMEAPSPKRVMRKVNKPGFTKVVEVESGYKQNQILFPETDETNKRLKNDEAVKQLRKKKEEEEAEECEADNDEVGNASCFSRAAVARNWMKKGIETRIGKQKKRIDDDAQSTMNRDETMTEDIWIKTEPV